MSERRVIRIPTLWFLGGRRRRIESEKNRQDFTPRDDELNIVDPLIGNLDISFVDLKNQILRDERIDEGRRQSLAEWVRDQRAVRAAQGGQERLGF